MLILDSYTTHKNFQNQRFIPKNQQEDSKEIKKLEIPTNAFNKNTMDWFLGTAFTEPKSPNVKQPKNPRANIFENPKKMLNKDLNKEILKEILNHSSFYKRLHRSLPNPAIHKELSMQEVEFISKIDAKLSRISNVDFEEVKEAQRFLEAQMDSIMLSLYKENQKCFKKAMERHYKIFIKGELEKWDSKEEQTISKALLEYGIREDSSILEDKMASFLAQIPNAMKNSVNNKEVDSKLIQKIEDGIHFYLAHKMESTGHRLFTLTADILPLEAQDKIIDAIANVIAFYSWQNTIEMGGYEVSWQPPPLGSGDNGIQSAISRATSADINIKFQVLLILPTKF